MLNSVEPPLLLVKLERKGLSSLSAVTSGTSDLASSLGGGALSAGAGDFIDLRFENEKCLSMGSHSRSVVVRRLLTGCDACAQIATLHPLPESVHLRRAVSPFHRATRCNATQEPRRSPYISARTGGDAKAPRMLAPTPVINLNVVSQAAGSCLLEWGTTKCIAAVYGPRARRAAPGQKQEFIGTGALDIDAGYASFASAAAQATLDGESADLNLTRALRTALDASVQLHRFPKSALDVYVRVLEDGGSSHSSAIVCASLALASAGVEMYDMVTSVTLCRVNDSWVAQPSASQEIIGQGKVTLSCMPSRQLITGLECVGVDDAAQIASAVETAAGLCVALSSHMRLALVRTVAV